MAHDSQLITWEQGWNSVEEWITNLMRRVTQGLSDTQESLIANMNAYTAVYRMCTQKEPFDHSEQLYTKFSETFARFYASSATVTLLKQNGDKYSMLREFVKIWAAHKFTLKRMSHAFHHLDRYYIPRRRLASLNEIGDDCFRNVVYREVDANVIDAVISLINKEREGQEIDRALLKNVISIFAEVGRTMDTHGEDLEARMLKDTGEYYSRKASNWIVEDTYTVYMSKAEECLRREREAAVHLNLQPHTVTKLVETVKHCLLVVYATLLVERKYSESGFGDSLTVDNVEELSKKFIASLKLEQEAEDVPMIQA